MPTKNEVVSIDTDVLVIGGGVAGCMAAIKARERDVAVTIAEKANTLASGCAGSGIDHMWAYVPEVHGRMGYSIDDMVESHAKGVAHGFIKEDLLHFIARESFPRVLDLESFGIRYRYDDSKVPGGFRLVPQFHSVPSSLNFDGRQIKVHLTKEARRRGAQIVNRVTVTDLLTSPDGHVAGALGVGTRDGKLYFFKTKAVVLSTGRVHRLTRNVSGVWGSHRIPVNETGDGRSMAFRAGLPIMNMEFLSPSNFAIGNYELNLGAPRSTTQPAGAVVEADGTVIVPRTHFYDWTTIDEKKVDVAEALKKMQTNRPKERPDYFELVRQGRGPFFLDLTGGTEDEIRYVEWSISHEGKGTLFLEYLKNVEKFDFRRDKLEWLPNTREMAGTASSGLVVNGDLETQTKGLFAAGDEVGGVPWVAATGAVTMGWHAGDMAAKEALRCAAAPETDGGRLDALDQLCSDVLGNQEGVHWREAEIAVQNIMDHYAGNVRAEKMLLRGVERLEDLKANVAFRADDPHELGRSLEVRSVMENAELVLRASLERRESRKVPFGFYRADFPEKNDRDYFAFLTLRRNGERVESSRIDIKRETG